MHFEKGVDISRTVDVLKRAALLICELGGGEIASPVTDIYPEPVKPVEIPFTYGYISRLSGKHYGAATIKGILKALGFGILSESAEGLTVSVPHHKTDITLPADIAEEIMRIDGFDNIAIPTRMSFSPSAEISRERESLREKISVVLTGLGFHEMLNNSITHSGFYSEDEKKGAVSMMNSLSAELDMLRPSMLETGLQTLAHNLNRKNLDLRLFEFGKTYATHGTGRFEEMDHLAIFTSGMRQEPSWMKDSGATDLFHLKGVVSGIFTQLGLPEPDYSENPHGRMDIQLTGILDEKVVVHLGRVSSGTLGKFDIRQDVWHADLLWDNCLALAGKVRLGYSEVPRFPTVTRDLAIVVEKNLPYARIRETTHALKLDRLRGFRLFDVFESEKLGAGMKSMALSFSFRDDEKTLTDPEVDGMMQRIISTFEKNLNAQIRR